CFYFYRRADVSNRTCSTGPGTADGCCSRCPDPRAWARRRQPDPLLVGGRVSQYRSDGHSSGELQGRWGQMPSRRLEPGLSVRERLVRSRDIGRGHRASGAPILLRFRGSPGLEACRTCRYHDTQHRELRLASALSLYRLLCPCDTPEQRVRKELGHRAHLPAYVLAAETHPAYQRSGHQAPDHRQAASIGNGWIAFLPAVVFLHLACCEKRNRSPSAK